MMPRLLAFKISGEDKAGPLKMANLIFILFSLVLAMFFGGCIWRMSRNHDHTLPGHRYPEPGLN